MLLVTRAGGDTQNIRGSPRDILVDGAGNLIVFSEEVTCGANGNSTIGVTLRVFSDSDAMDGSYEVCRSLR